MAQQFKRTGIMAIAKALRDEPTLTLTAKKAAVRALNKVFKLDNPMYDENTFRQLVTGSLERDYLTYYRKLDGEKDAV